MSLLEWQPEFSVGIDSVDAEHRELIDLINDLHRQMAAGSTQETVIENLGEIFARISAHFALEEAEMKNRRYDEYEAHKASHELLLDELRDIMDQVEDDGSYDEARLSSRLGDWFGEHFRTYDARLHRRMG